MQIEITGLDVLTVSIAVIFLGRLVTTKIGALQRYNIPPAVTGGLMCSLLLALAFIVWDTKITFDLELRDLLLLFFFSTIGLTARMRLLVEGGKTLAILIVVAAGLLVLQNSVGVVLARLFSSHPGYGLFAGSVSFAGGHGTAIAWGAEASAAGLVGAAELGIACATFGLVAGGIIGGPIGGWLIEKHALEPDSKKGDDAFVEAAPDARPVTIWSVLTTLLMLSVCVEMGDLVNRFLSLRGLKLPGFLTAMVVGIIICNASDALGRQLHKPTIAATGELSLQLFLSMSLMSMQLWIMASAATAIMLAVMAQALLMTLVAVYLVFRLTGRTYDSAVMASGFAGLGMGATPVAFANMNAITTRYGPSPKAFIVIPLIGAFFVDIINALVIKFFLGLPMMQQAAA
ncbi:MAG: sodium/glutamate symporter [Gammaproteobacteria bacterium]|nr:sodium/glutamate symporter [Gammaproteobacteria bacterium]NIR23642.1 sodium/glutamate symporter [Gammaproteobacteria bacterium]NIS05455.1 sodium/glutamate symporter [Gammaproteobacteria bacterium]NIU41839.1 sodium/glutamate symporter [Gammaproteobacteria bacterium]NIV47569.1 sodium/glutamate symporter [Gammaproteobacteria bacterium]